MNVVSVVNNLCTLKCRKCITRTPYQQNPRNFPTANIIRDMHAYFEIFNHVSCEHLDFEGGEALLHPEIHVLVEEALNLTKQGYCNEIRILTNCTVIPKQTLLNACKKGSFLFILDDYGPELSIYKNEIVTLLEKNKINYRHISYHGNNQDFGGWIELGNFEHKHLSKEETLYKHSHCFSARFPYIEDGKIFVCHSQMAGYRHIPLVEGEYIDILDTSTTLDEKRHIASFFGNRPIRHCEYCNGFIPENSIRIPAAEQLDNITSKMQVMGQQSQ